MVTASTQFFSLYSDTALRRPIYPRLRSTEPVPAWNRLGRRSISRSRTYTCLDEAKHDLVYDKGVLVNAQNVSIRDEFSRLAASKLSDGGHWISVSGNDDNLNADETGPDERGYPRLSVIELATAIEPYFEIQSITLEAFGSTSPNDIRSWVVISRKRVVPPFVRPELVVGRS